MQSYFCFVAINDYNNFFRTQTHESHLKVFNVFKNNFNPFYKSIDHYKKAVK